MARLDPSIYIVVWQYNIGKDMDGTVKYFAEHRNPETVILSLREGTNGVSSEDHIPGGAALAKEHDSNFSSANAQKRIPMEPSGFFLIF